MPFQPKGFIKTFITYNLSNDQVSQCDEGECPVSANFLFALVYLSFKPMLRKIIFKNTLRLTNSNKVSVPSKVLF